MKNPNAAIFVLLGLVLLNSPACASESGNLLDDPSFEVTKAPDQFGLVFSRWGGWKYEGDCSFAVGDVARSGRRSCLLIGGSGAKIRVAQLKRLSPGRYRITAYIRGLDIGSGTWDTTTEFMFNGQYMQLNKNGTFDWTKLTYVADVTEAKEAGPSFGLMAPGLFWIDDVELMKVGLDVPLTPRPVLATSPPITPPGDSQEPSLRCPRCRYRNNANWQRCYACGHELEKLKAATGPARKTITSFETGSPFSGGKVVEQHATEGKRALRVERSYVALEQRQNWLGYDYLKVDVFCEAAQPQDLYVEIRDAATTDYWTRVNYETVVPPGQSTLVLPLKQLYVGEKSRPGRMLVLNDVTRLVFNLGDSPRGALCFDHLRLERDTEADQLAFDGLCAYDFGLNTSPVMEGFTAVTPSTLYSRGRGYGLSKARVWRAFDALQPDPLYQDFICIESGGMAIDVPNGKYRVMVNVDSPSGFWGEYQVFRQRAIVAEGQPVVQERMDFEQLKRKYFRFWNVEDVSSDNTFDKYQTAYFAEKTFDVEVRDGQLNLEFQGENWACCVSAVVVFPTAKSAEGNKFLDYAKRKRRFYFDNYFHRILHQATGDPLKPSAEEQRRGYVGFVRDAMRDVYDNDTPRQSEVGRPLRAAAFAGELEPLTLALVPLKDLGTTSFVAGDLQSQSGSIPSSDIDVGYVSYRINRVTMQGSVYTIGPRMIMPTNQLAMPAAVTRRIWLTVKTPATAAAGLYRGHLSIRPEYGEPFEWPIEFQVRAGTLDPIDVPAGPWGYRIGIPWPDHDAAAQAYEKSMADKSLRKMREYGFTAFSGVPTIRYQGFANGAPKLDYSAADAMMDLARQLGFKAVVSYGAGIQGINAYVQDTEQAKSAGFQDYSKFIQAVYTHVQRHAASRNWLPVYYNLGDEPIGDELIRSAENAEAYRKAFPSGPPFFTAASSFAGSDANDPHFRLSKALHVVDWNVHDEEGVGLLQRSGGQWAFYNGGNRWTYGTYMYKAVHEFGMRFRLSWHWNVVAGDPYYALDCREDDYAWCNSSPDGQLVPSVHFEQLREGLDDYRRLLTLARLCKQNPKSSEAESGLKLIANRLGRFRLGQREHDELFGSEDWNDFREQLDRAIESFRK